MADWMLLLLPLLAVPVVLLFRFVGCTAFDVGEPEETFDFRLSADPTQISVGQGATTTSKITVTGSGGYNNEVTLTASPLAGLTLSFTPNKVNPKSGPVASTLTVTTSSTATVGKSGVTLEGKGPGAGTPPGPEISHTVAFTIDTLAAPPTVPATFTLSLTPPSLSVPSGTDAVFTVNINRVGGFSEAVTLTTTPTSPNVTFTPSPAPGATSTLRIRTTGAPTGQGAFTVTGNTPSGATDTVDGTLRIT